MNSWKVSNSWGIGWIVSTSNNRSCNREHQKISIDQIFDWREIPKKEYKYEIINNAHTWHKGHLKAANTYKEIMKSRKWWWTNMEEDISRFVKKCETWQIRTKNPDKTIAIKYIESDEAKERFQVDLVQLSDYLHLERRYLCNCVDHLSKFLYSRVIKHKTKEVVLAAIKEIFTIMGFQKYYYQIMEESLRILFLTNI